ncbi:type II toxin-antitoxin system RelE/ParE family toxin [Candidiatus Paracoxiella cheracis]|uniref:type II toxin-antitoxin system RelE/ParE family toxin n=1 Tax=Candidiatus Paracoxiella cheracis TaxID=3405120 RepID=UPI003BF4F6B0
MRIIYSRNAVDDLDRLRQFVAHHDTQAANKIANRLCDAINRLTEFPQMGKNVSLHGNDISLRDLVTGKYIIRYATIGKELHILRIWHGKEDL